MSAIFADAVSMLHKTSSPVWVVGLSCEDNGTCGYDACETANIANIHKLQIQTVYRYIIDNNNANHLMIFAIDYRRLKNKF